MDGRKAMMDFYAVIVWIADYWKPMSKTGRLNRRHDLECVNQWLCLVPAMTYADIWDLSLGKG
jgi:hypothetical protein